MMDPKRAMGERNPAWGCYYHKVGLAGVLEAWCNDSEEVQRVFPMAG
jgi:hypothetical protein